MLFDFHYDHAVVGPRHADRGFAWWHLPVFRRGPSEMAPLPGVVNMEAILVSGVSMDGAPYPETFNQCCQDIIGHISPAAYQYKLFVCTSFVPNIHFFSFGL